GSSRLSSLIFSTAGSSIPRIARPRRRSTGATGAVSFMFSVSVAPAVVAMVARDIRLDDARVVRIHDVDVDGVAGVIARNRRRIDRRPGGIQARNGRLGRIPEMPRDRLTPQRAQ